MAGFAKTQNAFPLSGSFSDNQKPTSIMRLTNNRLAWRRFSIPTKNRQPYSESSSNQPKTLDPLICFQAGIYRVSPNAKGLAKEITVTAHRWNSFLHQLPTNNSKIHYIISFNIILTRYNISVHRQLCFQCANKSHQRV